MIGVFHSGINVPESHLERGGFLIAFKGYRRSAYHDFYNLYFVSEKVTEKASHEILEIVNRFKGSFDIGMTYQSVTKIINLVTPILEKMEFEIIRDSL